MELRNIVGHRPLLLTGEALAQTGESSELRFFSRDTLPENIGGLQPCIEKWRAGDFSVTVD